MFTNKIQMVQRKATITMLGAMGTMEGDILNAHTLIPPPTSPIPESTDKIGNKADNPTQFPPTVQTHMTLPESYYEETYQPP